MATLRFPLTSVSSLYGPQNGAMANTGTNTNASIISGSSSAGPMSYLIIYKGTPETFPSFTDRATRASDVLITFTLGAAGSSNLGQVSNSFRMLLGKNLTNQAASASGTASWFLLCRAGTTSLTDKGAMIGSVGITGSGADLEIPSTSIIASNNYQSAGFFVNMPQNWTVP